MLVRNKNLDFLCKNIHLKIINNNNNFLSKFDKEIIELTIAHNDGNYFINNDSLKKLEDVAEQLESGEVDLEKSVELYEKGMELKKICEEKLKKVELQIKKIKVENNKVSRENIS